MMKSMTFMCWMVIISPTFILYKHSHTIFFSLLREIREMSVESLPSIIHPLVTLFAYVVKYQICKAISLSCSIISYVFHVLYTNICHVFLLRDLKTGFQTCQELLGTMSSMIWYHHFYTYLNCSLLTCFSCYVFNAVRLLELASVILLWYWMMVCLKFSRQGIKS